MVNSEAIHFVIFITWVQEVKILALQAASCIPRPIMRFHDKNNAVHLLIDGGSCKVEVDQNSLEFQKALFFVHHEFPSLRPKFRKSIQFMCKPFFEAYQKARDKLSDVLQKESLQKSGTLIYSLGSGYTLTTFYDLETQLSGQEMVANGRIGIFANFDNNPLPNLVYYTQIKDNKAISFLPLTLVIDGFTDQANVSDVLKMILFIKYCPVETKIVARGKKVSHAHQEYLNKTSLPIELLDSTWFTTIVRSEGFAVDGHFRLQPFGPGRSERKLIWIAPHEKTGYVRKAGVLRTTGNLGERLGE